MTYVHQRPASCRWDNVMGAVAEVSESAMGAVCGVGMFGVDTLRVSTPTMSDRQGGRLEMVRT